MTMVHIVRLTIGLVSFGVAGVCVARGAALRGVWRWGPWTIAGYAYSITAAMLLSYDRPLTLSTWWIAVATFLGLGYALHVLWAWNNPQYDLPRQKVTHDDPNIPPNPGIIPPRHRDSE